MSTIASRPTSVQTRVPPLQNGDRLTRVEFERRLNAMPHLKLAELIEGIVYVPPPVSHDGHSAPHFDLIGVLAPFRSMTPGIRGGDNDSIRLDLDNMPQPDAYLLVLPSHGGQSRISADGYVEGAPEFVAEVSASSASYDLHDKLQAYRRNGVREYFVWRVFDEVIDCFVLQDGKFEPLKPGADGIVRSRVLPGLWMDVAALARGDMATALRAAQAGIGSPEHTQFVAKLNAAK